MKRMKRIETQRTQVEGQKDTLYAQVTIDVIEFDVALFQCLSSQVDAIESMAMSKQVYEASQVTHKVMKESLPDADKIQDTLEDVTETVACLIASLHVYRFLSIKKSIRCLPAIPTCKAFMTRYLSRL